MTALMDAVATAAASVTRLYRVGSVPSAPTYPYGVFSAQYGRGDSYTLDSTAGARSVRVTFQGFGRTADSALAITETFIGALLDKALTVGGQVTTPLRIELDPTPPSRNPDDAGVIGVTATLTATQEM